MATILHYCIKIIPDNIDYSFDRDAWEEFLDPANMEHYTIPLVNTYITLFFVQLNNEKYRDFGLWEKY